MTESAPSSRAADLEEVGATSGPSSEAPRTNPSGPRRAGWLRTWSRVGAAFVLGLVVLPSAQRILAVESVQPDEVEYPINTIIQRIRGELLDAERSYDREGREAIFQVKHLDLELAFVVKRTSRSGAEGQFQLVAVSSDSELGTERVQRIQLHLEAIDVDRKFKVQSSSGPAAPEPPTEPMFPKPRK